MIYITGDTHMDVDIHKLTTKCFPEQKNLTKADYLIICGDFGMVWDNTSSEIWWRKWLDEKPWTTLFIDGNHDNHPLISTFPAEEKFGGTVRKVSSSIYYLPRGEVYNIDGVRFLVIGGADSHDKAWRIAYEARTGEKIWWEAERITQDDIDKALNNIHEKMDGVVDVVISHAAPYFIEREISAYMTHSPSSLLLGDLAYQISFKSWFYGHYHEDRVITDDNTQQRYIGVYQKVQNIYQWI